MSIELKPHNVEVYEKMQEKFNTGKRVAVIQPTGTGKSYLALKLLEESKGKKAIYLAPSTAILHNVKKSIFDSGMNMTDFQGLTRLTYTKLMNMSDEEIEKLEADIIILDEFHHCGAPEWGNGVNRLLERKNEANVLGLSATPIRYLDMGRDMAEELFNGNIASEMSLEEAVNNGILPEATYVSALYGYGEQLSRMQQDIDRIQEPTKRQEAQNLFQKLQGRLNEETQNLPELLSEHMTNKNGKYIVFCKNVEDMQQRMQAVQEIFGNVNPDITTYSVYASKGIMANERTLKSFEKADDDSLKLMFAVDMLNEGYHVKDLDGIIMMRPTFSPTIFVQQLGRALTIKNEGTNPPIILDLVNNFDSCKIIEDFCERMKQAESEKKEQDDKSVPRGRIAIFDKTKEFREIAGRVTELCKRAITIDEKIEIFKRFKQTGEELTGKTVFEGYPIGNWGMIIRHQINTHKQHFTDEQLDALNEMGILDRQIDSTIDEKIEAAINWCAKYPKAKIAGRVNIQDVLQEYAKNDEEFKKLQEQYERVRKYYNYITQRKNQGKLTKEQIEACKEGNIGGVFGFPSKTEELAKFYRIEPKKIDYILSKYGSMEEFVKAYMESDDLQFEKEGPLKDNIRPNFSFDISGKPHVCELIQIVNEHKGAHGSVKGIVLSDIEGGFLCLTPREEKMLRCFFGIYEGERLSYKKIGEKFGLTIPRVMQIIAKGVRKLSSIENGEFLLNEGRLKNKGFTPEEIERINKSLEGEIGKSNLIFFPDKEYENEPDSINIKEIYTRIIDRKREGPTEVERVDTDVDMSIDDDLDFSLDDDLDFSLDDLDFDWDFIRGNNSKHDLGEIVEPKKTIIQDQQEEQTTETNNDEASSKQEPTELEKAKLEREEVAQALAKLKEQVMSAEQLLAQYDELLGNKKQMGKTPGNEGE